MRPFMKLVIVILVHQQLLPGTTILAGECVPVVSDHSQYHCLARTGNSTSRKGSVIHCNDNNPECAQWAAMGECQNNPAFMLSNCPKSCHACVDGHSGITQISPDVYWVRAVVDRLGQTMIYVQREMIHNAHVATTCTNRDAHCTYWAVLGQCHSKSVRNMCAAACQSCHFQPH